MRNIKVAFSKSPYGPWSSASAPFTESFTEGPSTAKVGDWWYIYYDSYRYKIYGAHRTKDFKTFQDQTGAVSFPVGHKHGTVFFADEQLVEGLIKYNRDVVHYSGTTIARPERHDGGLKPVVGVHTVQTMRGEKPWTYNHQPMLAYWNGKFYMHYLTDPRHEHEAPGKTMLQTSEDGYTWTDPVELFPEYDVPEGWTKEDRDFPPAHHLKAVMHQRMGWYEYRQSGRLLAVANYGICLTIKDDPNDGNGIGRVVREIKKDGSFGPIYFIYYNHGFSEKNTDFPYYKRSKDKGFVTAVDAMLADPMQRMQWVEEADRNDPLIPLNKPYKAFSGYTLPDGRKVALWKHAVTSLSADGGNTWRLVDVNGKLGCDRAPGFVNSNAKIWGQRLSDGTYATVYNPAEYRWPLAVSLSQDGLEYNTLSLIHGEVTPLRHGGQYKSYGPQYVRGIENNEMANSHLPNDLWVTYSNNKEDMWVSRIPVPVRLEATRHAVPFGQGVRLADLTDWNIYSPQWAPVSLQGEWLQLSDCDPYDYAKVERLIPNTKELEVEFDLKTAQNTHGELDVEFLDDGGNVCSRIVVDSTGAIRVKGGARYGTLLRHYEAGQVYHIKTVLSASLYRAVYYLNGKKACERQFDTPVESISRIVFRTGMPFDKPDINTPADQDFDMPRADESDPTASFGIANITSRPVDGRVTAVLDYDDYAHYADHFNTMEDENIVTTIPNAQSSEWMRRNIPLFDCPQENFQEMYYYRWWTLRKHIKRTPVGYGMTEFLVQRSYADRYNLIACAIGHHVMESRWLRDTTYLHQILRTWYYGNDGKAMTKMNKFSSWNPAAILEMWKVQGDTTFMLGLKPRLEEEYARWEHTNRLANGLYWQGDVQDGMEESISGGRRKQYARPTINSYMYGNAKALAVMNRMTGEATKAADYELKADTLKNLIETKLWNEEQQFFETHRGDSSANVREAIGYIPWYFNMPESGSKYEIAWQQLTDEKGFSAPYGLTTAERRHPLFRSHGFGKCEWDGAIWPFATAQTLTALANYLNEGHGLNGLDGVFFRQMELYVESQHHRGRPYIGEYLDETNGAWLMGDRERSRYYNHSTFNDLMITGVCGLRPQEDGSIVVNPLVPQDKWGYFCLDGVSYRRHILTILWDKDGQRYHQGTGLTLMVDGEVVANRKDIGKLEYK
ncbi:MAG: six-hairpin glycosidase [Prevotella sp.]|nr:six-hairpin glycosidase [Prevotella sp.]